MMRRCLKISLVLWTMAFSAVAAEVDLAAARLFAKDWRGKGIRAARTHRGATGESRFHVVSFEGGGWAAIGADDSDAPVIAFSDRGEDLVEDERNAVWFLVKRDAERRARRAEVEKKGGGKGRRRHKGWLARGFGERLGAESRQAFLRGEQITGQATATPKTALGDGALDEICVAPLVQSTWNQKTANNYLNGPLCYNYYTPNNYYCGCVATMMAQIMRYFEWPKASVTAKTYPCYVGATIPDEIPQSAIVSKTMMGGVYDWSKMTLNPNSSTSEANRQEIGKLCYDAGVSVSMMWSSVGSGTFVSLVREAFVDTFGYANAHLVVYDYPTAQYPQVFHAYNFEELKTIVISNCEAGLPIGYGISGATAGGHAVVIDGYGYSNGEFYMHINPGWSGSSNAWYCPPNLSMGGYSFDESDELVYNIFPEGTGALVTGRVTNAAGEPVAGAEVRAIAVYQENRGSYFRPKYVARTNVLATVTTDARGKYHLKTGVTGIATTVVATAKKGQLLGTATTDLPRSQTMLGSRTNPFNGGYSTNSYSLGNKIDFDIRLEGPSRPPRVLFR